MNEFKKNLLNAIERHENICLLTHHEPDGDGLPATLALRRIFSTMGKDVKLILEEQAPDQFDYLNAKEHSLVVDESMHFDLVIVVDCHEQKRLGTTGFIAQNANECFVIDHHVVKDGVIDGAEAFVDTEIACVGIIIFHMFMDEMRVLSKTDALYCAECFYTTILNDTNSFMNANTDAFTLRSAAELEDFGVTYFDITEKFFYNDPWRKLKLVGNTMSTLEPHFHENVLFLHTEEQMVLDCEIGYEYLTKVISWVRSAKDILMIVYFKETARTDIKLSFRSKTINVAKIAADFDGGGHVQAAGGVIHDTLDNAKQLVINRLKECDELRDLAD